MFKVPVVYLLDVGADNEIWLRYMFKDLAAAGALHTVLGSRMIAGVMCHPKFATLLRGVTAEFGIDFGDAHAPYGAEIDLNVQDAALWRRAMLTHRFALELAADFGVKTLTVHVGNNHFEPMCRVPENKQIDTMRRSLDTLLPYAEQLGVTICIENIWFPVSTPEVLLELKSHFDTDALGFCFDSGHANLMATTHGAGDDCMVAGHWRIAGEAKVLRDDRILEKMLPHVVSCHLHDNFGLGDDHLAPGHGNIDWKHLVPLLKTAPRLRVVQCETAPLNRCEPLTGIIAAMEKISGY